MEISSTLADEQYAVRVAAAVLASFMQQPQDRKTMLRLLTQMLVGEPKAVLQRMVDPRTGIASQEEFFSLAAVKKWLNTHAPDRPFKPFPKLEEPEDPPELRAQRYAMLKATAQEIRDCVKAKTVGRPTPKHGEVTWEQRNEALENLKAMQPMERTE